MDIRCECDEAVEFTLTLLDSTSHDAVSFVCGPCALVVFNDWVEDHDSGRWDDVSGWTLERMPQNG